MEFLDSDQEKAERQLECFEYLAEQGDAHFDSRNYGKAASYYENAARSLRELDRMQEEKRLYDEAWFLLKQIKAEQQQKQLLYKLQVNIYE